MIKGVNYNLEAPTGISNGETFEDCNLMQKAPNTAICSGVTGLTFRRCNLANCVLPGDATIDDCGKVGVHKSRCSHIHPDWGLTACADNCSHVIDTDEVWVDGVLVETIYHYDDTRV